MFVCQPVCDTAPVPAYSSHFHSNWRLLTVQTNVDTNGVSLVVSFLRYNDESNLIFSMEACAVLERSDNAQ